MTDSQRFETAAIHAGQDPDPATGAAVGPIYQTSTYVQEGVARHRGYDYSRSDNPTRRALETCLAALEQARHCVAFGSGMAAIATLAMTLRSGERVVIPNDVYGGTYRLFDKVMGSLGLRYDTVDMTDLAAVRETLADQAALVLAESPTNPRLRILDLAALAELAHAAGARFVVDNTFATPYLQRPLRLGADAVVYSATKYLGGHSDLVMGAVTVDDDELAARIRFLQGSAGAVPGPFDSWLLLRGLKTLGVRMRQHCANAELVAAFLGEHPAVGRVHYPGLEDFPGHRLARDQMSAGGAPLYGGMVSFETESEEMALRVCEGTRVFFLAESLGGVESLIEHPGPHDPRLPGGIGDRGARHPGPALGRDRAPRRPDRRPRAGSGLRTPVARRLQWALWARNSSRSALVSTPTGCEPSATITASAPRVRSSNISSTPDDRWTTGSGGPMTSATSRSTASPSRKTRSSRLRSLIEPTISDRSPGESERDTGACEIPCCSRMSIARPTFSWVPTTIRSGTSRPWRSFACWTSPIRARVPGRSRNPYSSIQESL